MDVVKTYKFKLYNSHRNKKLHTQIDAAGLTYNHCVALHKRYTHATVPTFLRHYRRPPKKSLSYQIPGVFFISSLRR